MSAVRISGFAVAVLDCAFIWWGLSATAPDFGSDYASPSSRILVILFGGVLAIISLALLVGPGRSLAGRE